jgi:hypothetical protein
MHFRHRNLKCSIERKFRLYSIFPLVINKETDVFIGGYWCNISELTVK